MEYLAVLVPYGFIRILPYAGVRILAKAGGAVICLVPSCRKLITANIRCAMPELPEAEVLRIARGSTFHLCMNLLEFIWVHGEPARIERCYDLGEETNATLQKHIAAGERILFVNPHLGSWEASGVVAPYKREFRPVPRPPRMGNEDSRKASFHRTQSDAPRPHAC